MERSKLLPSGGEFHKLDNRQLVDIIRKAVKFGAEIGEITRDEEVEKYWHEIYESLSTGAGGIIGAVTSRAEAQTMRIACIYASLDLSEKIKIIHLMAALNLWKYCFKSARFIFGSGAVLNHPNAYKLLEVLKKRKEEGKNGMTRTEVSRGVFKGNVPKTELDMIFNDLHSNGFIKLEKEIPPGSKKSVQKITSSRLRHANSTNLTNLCSKDTYNHGLNLSKDHEKFNEFQRIL